MRRINVLIVFLLVFCLLLFACSTKNVESSSHCDTWVAVLPFANSTNDLEIPQLLRSLFIRRLIEKGYNVIPPDTVDSKLLRMGISDGGQLSAVSNIEIAESLDVDLLGYGNVVQADYITLGAYLEREVEVELSILGSLDSSTLWDGNGRAFTKEIYIAGSDDNKENSKDDKRSLWDRIKSFFTSVLKLIGIQLAEKVIVDLITHPLYYEASLAIDKATANLPFCSGIY